MNATPRDGAPATREQAERWRAMSGFAAEPGPAGTSWFAGQQARVIISAGTGLTVFVYCLRAPAWEAKLYEAPMGVISNLIQSAEDA